MTTELFLNFLGIRMDSRKAEGLRFTINLITPDNGEKFIVEMENATLTNLPGYLAEKPDRGWGPVRTRGDHRRQPDPRALLPQRGPRRLQPIRATPDIQWLRPGAGAIAENAFVYGVRINITF